MTLSTNFGWDIPDVNADSDTWGALTNDIWAIVDQMLAGQALGDEATVASAATADIGAANRNRVQITGTTTITSFGTTANCLKIVRFSGSLTLTYNGTSLITPSGTNIVTAAGDQCLAASDASGNWTVVFYIPKGAAIESSAGPVSVATGGTNVTSISLAPGKYRVSATSTYSGSASNDFFQLAIGTTSGSISTGTTLGKTRSVGAVSAANGQGGIALAPVEITVATTTTYYLISQTPTISSNVYGYICAEKIT